MGVKLYRLLVVALLVIFSATLTPAAVFAQNVDPNQEYLDSITKNTAYYMPEQSCDSTQTGTDTTSAPANKNIYVLGDSLMLGLQAVGLEEAIQTAGFTAYVNAQPGRALSFSGGKSGSILDAFSTIDQDEKTTHIKVSTANTIVIDVGSIPSANFQQNASDLVTKINKLNPNHPRIFWVNLAGTKNVAAYAAENTALQNLEKQNVLTVIDWFGATDPNRAYTDPLGTEDLAGFFATDPAGYLPTNNNGYEQLRNVIVNQLSYGDEGETTDTPAPSANTSNCDDINSTSSCTTAELPAITNPGKVANAIDQFVQANGGAGSPFDGLGSSIVNGAIRSQVNPFLIVAIARKESSFGTAGIATGGTYNAFGRTATSGQPSVDIKGRLWYKYPDWKKSVDDSGNTNGGDQAAFIRNVYIDNYKLTKISDVILKYAPPGENDSATYISQLNQWISDLVQASGDGISCNNNTAAPNDPKGNVALGKQLAAVNGWGDGPEWECLYQLWQHESGWNEKADNPSSSAYGIPQALPGSKMSSEGSDWKTNPATQIKWGMSYIKGRPDYGTPCAAWTLWQRRSPHWY